MVKLGKLPADQRDARAWLQAATNAPLSVTIRRMVMATVMPTSSAQTRRNLNFP
jgi:hypothetical protein